MTRAYEGAQPPVTAGRSRTRGVEIDERPARGRTRNSKSSLPALGRSGVRTAHRDVADRLRHAIVSGTIAAGTHLVQAELANTLNVSVTPVREALRDLENEGLVDFDPFRGATVHAVSLDELEEIYELRRVLIPLAIRERIHTITDEELDEAERLTDQMTLDVDDAQWVEANRALHTLLDGASNLPHLRRFLRRLADISALYVELSVTTDPERRRRARNDHKALIAAYRTRNAEAVTAITTRHLNDTAAVAAAALKEKSTEPRHADD
ncbi:Putative GntR family transcriptional regulator (modular protein) [Frankia canadensis]|uniref:GntR family transcriptional regulator (Modular protein) n=1 Tax=Frankia canadensis TaxID=1836972 RepID=A0A2I2KIC1_9ACTN|nr:GntR family transcriptional regulator [Frankia canadensis]SNQ45415.1 Putative GntR family transcriptional regulator (modular protein) [Frankia canadensis]SOU52705.1 Putative GntR family transcriptional regulator (modular protein) [Frankia canadensis]